MQRSLNTKSVFTDVVDASPFPPSFCGAESTHTQVILLTASELLKRQAKVSTDQHSPVISLSLSLTHIYALHPLPRQPKNTFDSRPASLSYQSIAFRLVRFGRFTPARPLTQGPPSSPIQLSLQPASVQADLIPRVEPPIAGGTCAAAGFDPQLLPFSS